MGGTEIGASRLEPRFAPLLRHQDMTYLEGLQWPAYGMWADATLAYFNPAYARSAPRGWGIGACALDAAGVLRPTLSHLHEDALTGGEPVTFRYACPTPSHARTFELSLTPLDGGRGLLAQHSLVVERIHSVIAPAVESAYRAPNGLVTQCAHCRRTRRVVDGSWDVVPELIGTALAHTTHGVCPSCEAHYFTPILARKGSGPHSGGRDA